MCANTGVGILFSRLHSDDAVEESHSHSHSHTEETPATDELQEFIFHISLQFQIFALCLVSIGYPLYQSFHEKTRTNAVLNGKSAHRKHTLVTADSVHVAELTEVRKYGMV